MVLFLTEAHSHFEIGLPRPLDLLGNYFCCLQQDGCDYFILLGWFCWGLDWLLISYKPLNRIFGSNKFGNNFLRSYLEGLLSGFVHLSVS